jgi:hypothetical protein
VQKARSVAAEFRHTYGYEIPVDYLASRLADQAQVYTQVGLLRLVSCSVLSPRLARPGPGLQNGAAAAVAGYILHDVWLLPSMPSVVLFYYAAFDPRPITMMGQ